MTSPVTFKTTEHDADGYRTYQSRPLTDGLRFTVWREDRGVWRWSLGYAQGYELPADQPEKTNTAAMAAARAWWTEHGRQGFRAVRKLRLGSPASLLANTSEDTRTAKEPAHTQGELL